MENTSKSVNEQDSQVNDQNMTKQRRQRFRRRQILSANATPRNHGESMSNGKKISINKNSYRLEL